MQLPKAWTEAGKVVAKTKTTAKIDMSADVLGRGLCPDCRQPMEAGFAADHPVMVCHKDRIALPVKD